MKDAVEEMQEYYAKRAGVYDASMGYENPKTIENLTPVVDLMKELLRDRSVLEIACGPCFWTHQLSSAVKSVLATDYNSSMLDQARRKALNWDKVSLQLADAYDMPGLPMTFDACMAVDWFAHVPRSRFHEFLRSIHGRLGQHATVVFCDQLPGTHSITDLRDADGNHMQERTLPDGSHFNIIKHFLGDDEVRSILSPYSTSVDIRHFTECRRAVVSYRLDGEQVVAADKPRR